MLELLSYLLFILTVALAAGSVVLSSRLRNKYHNAIFSSLLYFQVFIYTFGFYGIWGQELIKVFLTNYISSDLLLRFSDIAILLGLPFLVFGWLMLIQFSYEISGRKKSNMFVFWFLLLNFMIIILLGVIIAKVGRIQPGLLLKYYFIIMESVYAIWSGILILSSKKGDSVIHSFDRKRVAGAIFFSMLIQCLPLIFYSNQPVIAIIFTFAFFAGNTFLPVYLNYGTLFTVFASESARNISFEEFCAKFEISPRETDIVREICNGLSNKEISEKLFISIQTVKDHTHRIYLKTNVKSRMQLIYLIKELKLL